MLLTSFFFLRKQVFFILHRKKEKLRATELSVELDNLAGTPLLSNETVSNNVCYCD